MRKLIVLFTRGLLATLLCLSQATAQAGDALFSEAELDQMVAPIALYPDALLAQSSARSIVAAMPSVKRRVRHWTSVPSIRLKAARS